MDFTWSREQTAMREKASSFARGALNSGLSGRDLRGEFNHEGWTLCANFGIQGLPMPRDYGGGGADAVTTVGVLERLGYGCKDNGLIFSINAQMWTLEMPLLHFGNEAQRQRWLPGLISGELIGGNAMTEPNSGSDAYALSTVARRGRDSYVLNGSKVFVSNASVADVLLVYARLDSSAAQHNISAFLVEKGTPGLTIAPMTDKMGLRTSPMAQIFLEDCEIPVGNLLGSEGCGIELFTFSMTWERACILASAVGSMDRLVETCTHYAKTRRQSGQAIGKFQLVASKLVDMKLNVETARMLLYRTAWLRDQERSIFLDAALTKLHISESWVKCAEDAISIHGGYGYMKEFEVERELRDALGSRIYSGTSEIQRLLIASLLGL